MPSCRRILLTVLVVLTMVMAMRGMLGPLLYWGPDWTMWGSWRGNLFHVANARSGIVWGVFLALAIVLLHRPSRASQLFVRAAMWAAMLDALSDALGRWWFFVGDVDELTRATSVTWNMRTDEMVSASLLLLLPGTVLLLMGRQGLDDNEAPSSVRFSGLLALASVLVGAVGILGAARSVGLAMSIGGVFLGLLLVVTAHGLARMRVWALASYVLLTTVVLALGAVELVEAVQPPTMTAFQRPTRVDVATVLMPALLLLQLLVVAPVILAITRGHPVPENPRRERMGYVATQAAIVLLLLAGAALLITSIVTK